MTPGASNVRVLSPDQSRRLLEVHRYVATSGDPHQRLSALVALISQVMRVKCAFVGQVDSGWTLLAASGAKPDLPDPGDEAWEAFDSIITTLATDLHTWSYRGTDWTLVGLPGFGEVSGVLLIEGDWRLSSQSLLQFAEKLHLDEFVNLMLLGVPGPSQFEPNLGVATHRLTRTLGRVTGLRNVCSVVLRHVVRAVPSRLAVFATPTEDDHLAIVATHGYPLELVEHVRIVPGNGVIGSVYRSRTPLWVPDVSALPGLRRRPRYRTNSFVAVPVSAGSEVLGVLCVTDRLDNAVFSREDLSTISALAAPAALALARERASQKAESFAHAAIIDPVSGLFNRRYFHERLDEELQRAQRHKTPVALLMVDIDDFKSINDQYGHMAGDTVIKGISEILRRSVRRFDLCTRFGGEEFAIVMPGSGEENSTSVAERIRQRIEAFQLEEPELANLRVTASIGLSVSHDMSARELIDRADQALYNAKRAGKNRVFGERL